MPRLPRLVAPLLAPLLAVGCATVPHEHLLCGTWAGEGLVERWWDSSEDELRGEARMVRGGEEVVLETLALRRTDAGWVYVAKPGDAEPTEFQPIDPAAARFGPELVDPPPSLLHLAWANYEHDFPQEIHYLLDLKTGPLTAIVAGPGQQQTWTLAHVAVCTDPP